MRNSVDGTTSSSDGYLPCTTSVRDGVHGNTYDVHPGLRGASPTPPHASHPCVFDRTPRVAPHTTAPACPSYSFGSDLV